MARARSPGSIEAEKLYQDGMKLVDIAKKIGVPSSTVRRWKSTQKWDGNKSEQSKKKETERSDKKKPNARIKGNRALGKSKEHRLEIKMPLAMPHPRQRGIKMRKSMGLSLSYTGIP